MGPSSIIQFPVLSLPPPLPPPPPPSLPVEIFGFKKKKELSCVSIHYFSSCPSRVDSLASFYRFIIFLKCTLIPILVSLSSSLSFSFFSLSLSLSDWIRTKKNSLKKKKKKKKKK